MPRRNQRERVEYPPIDLTPKPDPFLSRPRTQHPYRLPSGKQIAEQDERNAERQRLARINAGVDWSTCLVPGCGRRLADWLASAEKREYLRDPERSLPLCKEHAIIVWQEVQRHRFLPDIVETAEQMSARHHAEAMRRQPVDEPQTRGDALGEIYYVRINDLVKVGWTQTLPRRLKEYGAGAVLLCHYPGTFDDETTLHRHLTAVRAKGREWYHDCEKIRRYVAEAIEQHGPPTTKAAWTVPKNPVTIIRQASTG